MTDRNTVAFAKVFTEEHHVEQFLDGKLYFNKVAFFKQYTNDKGEKRGDPLEGCIGYFQTDEAEIEINNMKIEKFRGKLAIFSSATEDKNAFCLYSIHFSDEEIKDIDFVRKNFKLEEELFKFGEHSVYIQNVGEFIDRLNSALRNLATRSRHMYVRHFDPDKSNQMFPEAYWGFYKSTEFLALREYRVVIDEHTIERNIHGGVEINIGSLRDIAYKIPTNHFNQFEIIRIEHE